MNENLEETKCPVCNSSTQITGQAINCSDPYCYWYGVIVKDAISNEWRAVGLVKIVEL